jgi:uncharacterized protein (DUF2344 family)
MWSDPHESELEALLSRGDRRLSATVERAHDLGAVFDGWSDHRDSDAWHRAIVDTGVDLERELGPRDLPSTLPWDLIDAGVRKNYLKAEWRRAQREISTEDCKWGHCYRCGIPGDGEDIVLAPHSLPVIEDSMPLEDAPKAAAYRLRPEPTVPPTAVVTSQPPLYRRHRFTFSKTGDARFLSHRQLMDTLERVLRAARLPVRYTEGFNPHIRVSMGPALAVGHEGMAELFDVDCTAPIRREHVRSMNRLLPGGVEIHDVRALVPGAPSLGKLVAAARYRIPAIDDSPWPPDMNGIQLDARKGVLEWTVRSDGSLYVELNQRQKDGPLVSVKDLMRAAGVSEEQIPKIRAERERLVLRRGNPPIHTKETGPKVVEDQQEILP